MEPHIETVAERAALQRHRGFTTADYRAARAIRQQLMETDGDTLYAQLPTTDWLLATAKLIAAARKTVRKAQEVRRAATR